MSRSERFSWIKPRRMAWVLIVLVTILILPAGLHFWQMQAVKGLIDAIESNDISATENALNTVKERKSTNLALSRLIELLESESKGSNTFAFIHALSEIGPPAISALRDVVESHDDTNFRIHAIGILGGMVIHGGIGKDVKKAVPTLLRALKDEDKSVRFQAALVISHIEQTKAKETLPVLLFFLKDEDRDIRFNAAFGIGKFGKHAEDAFPELLEALNDPDRVVRAAVTSSIGDVGIANKNVIDALIGVLKDKNAVGYRNRAARSLGQFGPQAKYAVPDLLASLKSLQNEDDFLARCSIIEALGNIGHYSPEVIQALIDALNDTRFSICRDDAAVALGKLGPKAISAVPDLIKASRDYDDGVEDMDRYSELRMEAVKALEKIDPPTARRIKNEPVMDDQDIEAP